MSEKLCLQWNDFKENAVNTFGSLREDKDFTDVTLVSDDGKQVGVHKVILANASPFFQNILRKNKHIHPLIYMRGVKSDDLLAIVDFLYCGETSVYQKDLESFLAIAADLKLKGLMGKDEEIQDETFKLAAQKKVKPSNKNEPNILKSEGRSRSKFGEQMSLEETTNTLDAVGGEVAVRNYFPPGDLLQELDEKCISMMEKTSGKNARGQIIYRCKVCGKEEINGGMKNHIENKHLEGVSIPCNFCEKTFRSKNSLSKHTYVNHKDWKDKNLSSSSF